VYYLLEHDLSRYSKHYSSFTFPCDSITAPELLYGALPRCHQVEQLPSSLVRCLLASDEGLVFVSDMGSPLFVCLDYTLAHSALMYDYYTRLQLLNDSFVFSVQLACLLE
jgi:hypothetical protein